MTKRLDAPSAAVRIRVMKRDRFQCTYCGVPGTDAELEIDHIIAVSNGGSHHISNLTTACRACNQEKGAGAMKAQSRPSTLTGLVGMWFHTLKDGEIHWQGQILSVDGDVVLAQLYEWICGYESGIEVIPKSVIYSKDCKLYPSHEHMNEAYRVYSIRRENEFNAKHGDGIAARG